MAKGKQTCKILKEIRKQIAVENDIKLVIEECTYQGDCKGTCPKCEAEVRYLERELEKRQRLGKAAIFAGMTIGTAITAASCGPLLPPPDGMLVEPEDTITATTDTIRNDSVGKTALLEGEVMAPVPDTMKAEEKKTGCKSDVELVIPGDIVEVDGEIVEDLEPLEGIIEGPVDEGEPYVIVDQMPAFPGGEAKLLDFIKKNTRYPQEAKDAGIQGRVFVYFVVETDGSIGDVKILRGIGDICDEEAMRVVKSMPKWKPGKLNGELVRVSYQVPIHFKLDNTQE